MNILNDLRIKLENMLDVAMQYLHPTVTALHLAMLALKIGKDDEVITSNFTYVVN